MGSMLKILGFGIVGAAAYELYKRVSLATASGFVMTPGHLYSLTFAANVTPAGKAMSQADAQLALSASAPQMFNVVSTPTMTATGFAVSVTYEGPAQTISAAHLTSGWNATEVTSVTLLTATDTGAAPTVSPTAAAVATANATPVIQVATLASQQPTATNSLALT